MCYDVWQRRSRGFPLALTPGAAFINVSDYSCDLREGVISWPVSTTAVTALFNLTTTTVLCMMYISYVLIYIHHVVCPTTCSLASLALPHLGHLTSL